MGPHRPCPPCVLNNLSVLLQHGSKSELVQLLATVDSLHIIEFTQCLLRMRQRVFGEFLKLIIRTFRLQDHVLSALASRILFNITKHDPVYAAQLSDLILLEIVDISNLDMSTACLNILGRLLGTHGFSELGCHRRSGLNSVLEEGIKHTSSAVRASVFYIVMQGFDKHSSGDFMRRVASAAISSLRNNYSDDAAKALRINSLGMLYYISQSHHKPDILSDRSQRSSLYEAAKQILRSSDKESRIACMNYFTETMPEHLGSSYADMVYTGIIDIVFDILCESQNECTIAALTMLASIANFPSSVKLHAVRGMESITAVLECAIDMRHSGMIMLSIQILTKLTSQGVHQTDLEYVGRCIASMRNCISLISISKYDAVFQQMTHCVSELLLTKTARDMIGFGLPWSETVISILNDILDSACSNCVRKYNLVIQQAVYKLYRDLTITVLKEFRSKPERSALLTPDSPEQYMTHLVQYIMTEALRKMLQLFFKSYNEMWSSECDLIHHYLFDFLTKILSHDEVCERYNVPRKLAELGILDCAFYSKTMYETNSGVGKSDLDGIALSTLNSFLASLCAKLVPQDLTGVSPLDMERQLLVSFPTLNHGVDGLMQRIKEKMLLDPVAVHGLLAATPGTQVWSTPQGGAVCILFCAQQFGSRSLEANTSDLLKLPSILVSFILNHTQDNDTVPVACLCLVILCAVAQGKEESLAKDELDSLDQCISKVKPQQMPFNFLSVRRWIFLRGTLSEVFPQAISIELDKLYPGDNPSVWKAVDVTAAESPFITCLQHESGLRALLCVIKHDPGKHVRVIAKAALLLRTYVFATPNDGSELDCSTVNNSWSDLLDATLSLITHFSQSYSRLPATGVLLEACTDLLRCCNCAMWQPPTAYNIEKRLFGIAKICIQWVLSETDQYSKATCFLFLQRFLSICLQTSDAVGALFIVQNPVLVDSVLLSATGLKCGAEKVHSLALLAEVVNASSRFCQASAHDTRARDKSHIHVDVVLCSLHSGPIPERLASMELFMAVVRASNRAQVLHCRGLSANLDEEACVFDEFFMGLQNVYAIGGQGAKVKACQFIEELMSSTWVSAAQKQNFRSQRWTYLLCQSAAATASSTVNNTRYE